MDSDEETENFKTYTTLTNYTHPSLVGKVDIMFSNLLKLFVFSGWFQVQHWEAHFMWKQWKWRRTSMYDN